MRVQYAPWTRATGRLLVATSVALLAAGCAGSSGSSTSGGSPTPTPTPEGPGPEPACTTTSDSCQGAHSSVFAISHSFNDPGSTVLYRVTVPAWETGTGWGDGNNGFFYQATVSGNTDDVRTYVPFNGMGGANGKPQLPQFRFLVPVDVSAGASATSITITACSSNYQFDDQQDGPACTKQYWTDSYSPLPMPVVGDPPFFTVNLEFADGEMTTQIPNNGVYTGALTIDPGSLSEDDADWLYDHMVFFDLNGDPYTNDIFDDTNQNHRSIGVLTIDEAAFLSPPGGTVYYTKYGSVGQIKRAGLPQKQFFFYTKDDLATSMIDVGAEFIYDQSTNCPGWINDVGSQASTCEEATAVEPGSLPNIQPYAQVIPETDQGNNVSATANGIQAGTQEQRVISFFASSAGAKCANAVNPLAVDTSDAFSPPNFVIDDLTAGAWGTTFPNGLYYVVPSGFGNCIDPSSGTNNTPFCHRAQNYSAYVPHYAASEGGGSGTSSGGSGALNGGSTTAGLVGSFTLADEYTVGSLAASQENSLVWFDNCGYGYVYEECPSCETQLGTRKSLPQPPNGFDRFSYTLLSHFDSPIVFGKKCCASWYQPNADPTTGQCNVAMSPCPLEPLQQIDDSYGMFLPGVSTGTPGMLDYQTLFSDEAIVVYDPTTGAALFKIRLNIKDGAVYGCGESGGSIEITAASDTDATVDIGMSGQFSIPCAGVGQCPFGSEFATENTSGMTVATCTVTSSSFLLGVEDWANQLAGVGTVQLRAWGGPGAHGENFGSGGGGGKIGDPGFAMTVVAPSDLTQDLYAYVGEGGTSSDDGGSATLLTKQPLSLHGSDAAMSTTVPSTIGVQLLAGGGGGGGNGDQEGPVKGGDGGGGGVAIANTNPSGSASSAAGHEGFRSGDSGTGGQGGNADGAGGGGGSSGGDNSGSDGVGGWTHGNDEKWKKGGSLIPPGLGAPEVTPTPWAAGKGGKSYASGGRGGGGFGGGEGGGAGNGGGGGGSWACGNTAYDPNAPTSSDVPTSPSSTDGAVQLVYEFSTGANCQLVAGTERVDCSFLTTQSTVDLEALVTNVSLLFQQSVSATTPMWIQAWGADGVRSGGNSAGAGGYAQTVTTLDDYQSTYGTTSLHYFIAAPGSSGGESGGGGASTIVTSAGSSFSTDNVLLIAGGGGGDGGKQGDHPNGGAGGSAIAGVSSCQAGSRCPNENTPSACGMPQSIACCGAGAAGAVGGDTTAAGGGNAGKGGAAGSASVTTDAFATAGSDCIGGQGGVRGTDASQPPPPAGWINTGATVIAAKGGNGGVEFASGSKKEGGGGGGGFGSGGGGWAGVNDTFGGGGGGGSYAALATVDDGSAPGSNPGKPSAAGQNGFVQITFNP